MNNLNYTTQNELLLNNLMEFYKDENNLTNMLKIITGESKISLRIVDWFATNYAKKNYTLFSIEENDGSIKRFKVYFDYKLKLKAYRKRRFDPFCRWDRISIPYKNGTCIETTIGQLNFFKFAIQHDIINYALENITQIENDMNTTLKTRENEKKFMKVQSIKRKELSVPGNKSVHITRVSAVIKFI
jgi:hypothetical protein